MKKIFVLAVGLLCALLTNAQSFSVNGTVTDSLTGEPLPGAYIIAKEQSRGASTSLTGRYSFTLFTGGTVEFTISYVGYQTVTRSVELNADGATTLDIRMQPLAGELAQVIITGNLQGQAKALNQQRTAGNVKNVIAADQIGRFPDPNAAEALQRVQGVNIERDQGEGRYVLIRGLAPQFTNVSINGEQIPSPEADVRFVALDAVPSDQLASLEVSKTLTPDMDGDAVGGSVNLITRTATTATPQISGSAVLGYNNLMGEVNGQGSLQYGQRFADNKLGVMLNASYYTNNLGSDNWERDPDGDISDVENHLLELRDYELTRTRTGASATIDYRFSASSEIYLRGIYNRFTDREWRRRYVFAPADNEIEKLTKDRFEEQNIHSINLGGRHKLGSVEVDYEGAYAYADQQTPFDNEVLFLAGDVESNLDFTSDQDFARFTTTPNYLNNDLYNFEEFESGGSNTSDENITLKFNVAVPYKTGNSGGTLKFGAKARQKDKELTITNNKYEAVGDVPGLPAFEGGLLDDNFLGGEYELSTFADMGNFLEYFNSNPQQFELSIEDKLVDEAVEAFTAEEDVIAAYAMTTHRFDKLTVIAGVRYENTTVSYTSSDVIFGLNGDLLGIVPVQGETDYGYLLPQVNLKYEVSPNTILRAAATQSYSRPNFIDIVPAQEANLQDREASVGNPDLNPVLANNFDLFVEHYFSRLGLVSGGLYYKQLTDFIYSRRFIGNYPLVGDAPMAEDIQIIQSQNGEQAALFGIEFGFQRQLDFLPGFAKNLGLYMNYTYTTSDAEFQRGDELALESTPLPGQTDHLGNFALGYESNKLTARASLNFNGRYLSEIGASPADDLYVKQRMQLDVTLGYKVSDNVRVFGEFLNLTNQPFETFSGSDENLIQREFYSWWSRIGVKVNL